MKRLAIVIAVLLIVLAVVALAMRHAARVAFDAVERQRHDILGLAIDIGGYKIDWRGAALTLNEIKIYPAGHEDEGSVLASADELRITLAPRDILSKTLHAREVVLVRPKISLVHNKDGSYNWSCLNLGGEKQKAVTPTESEAKEQWNVIIDSVRIEDGEAQYRGLVKGHRLDLTDLDLSLTDIASETDPAKMPSQLAISGQIDKTGGRITASGRANAFAEGINFDIKAHMSGTPITYFHSFYAGQTPYPIESGTISISSKAHAEKSMLRSSHHASITGLRVGGGLKGDLINRLVLARRGPVEVDAQVNGDLSSGKLSVGTALTTGIGDGIMTQAKQVSPLDLPGKAVDSVKNVGDTVGGGAKKAGGSVGSGFQRIFRK